MGVSRSKGQLFFDVAPCLLGSVNEVTLSEHEGGSRTPAGLPIFWQIRKTQGAPDPPSAIQAGTTPSGFVTTVPFRPPPLKSHARYNVLIDLDIADVGSMSFQLQAQPGGSNVPKNGDIFDGAYKVVSQSKFESAVACQPQGALVADPVLSAQDAQTFAPASNPLAPPPGVGKVLLDLSSSPNGAGKIASSRVIGRFKSPGSYSIYAECSGTSIQVSEGFSPAANQVEGQRYVIPCRGGWTPQPPVPPAAGTSVTIIVSQANDMQWRVVAFSGST